MRRGLVFILVSFKYRKRASIFTMCSWSRRRMLRKIRRSSGLMGVLGARPCLGFYRKLGRMCSWMVIQITRLISTPGTKRQTFCISISQLASASPPATMSRDLKIVFTRTAVVPAITSNSSSAGSTASETSHTNQTPSTFQANHTPAYTCHSSLIRSANTTKTNLTMHKRSTSAASLWAMA